LYESASNHASHQADGIPQAKAKTSASDLGISERSVYRYLKMYEQLGYQLIKDNHKKYYLK
jgi:biotin operon repressor